MKPSSSKIFSSLHLCTVVALIFVIAACEIGDRSNDEESSRSADLASMSVRTFGATPPLLPSFDPSISEYRLDVRYNQISLSLSSADPAATITVNGALVKEWIGVTLQEIETPLVIRVANGRAERTYLLTVTQVEDSLDSDPAPNFPSGCADGIEIDPMQPPTCYRCKSPEPQSICGPFNACPNGFQCFVLPLQMDCCNNCPIQYSSTCT